MRRVTIVGGGFSGLTTAYFLLRQGVPVTLVEKQDRLGGLIDTIATAHGPVESAANGIRNTGRLELLCRELDVPLVHTKPESRKRYLFRDGAPHLWPLKMSESAVFFARLGAHLVTARFSPRAGESVEQWGHRVLGRAATHFILSAGLQGIYAGDPSKLSASLLFRGRRKPPAPFKSGFVAPAEGMGQLIRALGSRIAELGGDVRTGAIVESLPGGPTVLCTSARDSAALLRERAPDAASAIGAIEMVPLVRVTAFYPASENTIPGFGVLFPRDEGIRALGVLFNTNIFSGRGEGHSESWIFAGALDREILKLDDDALFEVMDRDRERLYGRSVAPRARYSQRWPSGLPHYDVRMETVRSRGFSTPDDVFLAGNYVRGIGLPILLEQAWAIAETVRARVG